MCFISGEQIQHDPGLPVSKSSPRSCITRASSFVDDGRRICMGRAISDLEETLAGLFGIEVGVHAEESSPSCTSHATRCYGDLVR